MENRPFYGQACCPQAEVFECEAAYVASGHATCTDGAWDAPTCCPEVPFVEGGVTCADPGRLRDPVRTPGRERAGR